MPDEPSLARRSLDTQKDAPSLAPDATASDQLCRVYDVLPVRRPLV